MNLAKGFVLRFKAEPLALQKVVSEDGHFYRVDLSSPRGGIRVWVDAEDHEVDMVASDAGFSSTAGQSLTDERRFASFEDAEAFGRAQIARLVLEGDHVVTKVEQPRAIWPAPEGVVQRCIHLEAEPRANGHRVLSRGCVLEIDSETGALLEYHGKWHLPPIAPAPSRWMSRDEACRAWGTKPRIAELGYLPDKQGINRLCWKIVNTGSGVVADAATGEVYHRSLYKSAFPRHWSAAETRVMRREAAKQERADRLIHEKMWKAKLAKGFRPARPLPHRRTARA